LSIQLNKLKPSASMEVTRLSKELKEAGQEVFGFSIGDTHFDPPAAIAGRMSQLPVAASHYGPAQGLAQLREAISKFHGSFTSDEVAVVPGLKQGFYYALQSLEKSTVAVLEPAWLGYQATCVLAGYDYLSVNTYKPEWLEHLESMDFDVLMACIPNNPDGSILTERQVDRILQVLRSKDAWLVLDTIYDHYAYDTDIKHLLSRLESYPKLIVGNGFSKSHAMTGYRIGYLLVRDEQVMANIIKIQQNLATCPSSFAQHLLAENTFTNEIDAFKDYYAINREVVLDIFPKWKPFRPDGGFYYFVDLSQYGIEDGEAFCKHALRNSGAALVPGTAYGQGFEKYVRLSFSLERQTLRKGLLKLKELIDKEYAQTNS